MSDMPAITGHGALVGVLPHLQKYGVFDDVTLEDIGPSTFEFHCVGPKLRETLGEMTEAVAFAEYRHHRQVLDGVSVWLVWESPTGRQGVTLIGRNDDRDRLHQWLQSQGFLVGDAATFEALRIEAGIPVYGRDVNPENLPQEIARDRQAISFTKGCYLGQETVARLDALGHVNKILRGLIFDAGPVPRIGTPLTSEGKPASGASRPC